MAEVLWCEPDRAKWVGVRPGLYGDIKYDQAYLANANGTLYTVPAGFTFLLQTFTSHFMKATASTYRYTLHNSTGAPVLELHYIVLTAPNGNYSLIHSFPIPMEIKEGESLRVVCTGAGNITMAGYYGVLVDNTLMGN